MNGLFGTDPASVAATWVAALVTLVVLAGLLGERRLFGWTQHLLAGLATGYLGLLAVTEVIVPRLVQPVSADPTGSPEAWLGLVLGYKGMGVSGGSETDDKPIREYDFTYYGPIFGLNLHWGHR